MNQWERVSQVAKNDAGEYVALIGGKWEPVSQTAKNDAGEFMALRAAPRPRAPIQKPAFEREAEAIANLTPAQVIAGNPVTRFAIGAAEPVLGFAQLLAALGTGENPLGGNIKSLQDLIEQGRAGYGSKGLDAYKLAGNVLSPVGLGVAKALGPATNAAQRIGQGMAAGTVGGATTPVPGESSFGDYLSSAGANAGIGATVGAVVPGALEATKKVGGGLFHAVDTHMLPGGAKRSATRLAQDVAGSNGKAVANALESSADIVPGSRLTAGQASVPVNSSEFAALQKIAASYDPSRYYGPKGVEGAQEGARKALIDQIGQSKGALDKAVSDRGANALRDYGQAFSVQIRGDPQLAKLFQNPYVQKAVGTAKDLADANGVNPRHNLTEYLHFVKVGIDKQLGKTGDDALTGMERKAAYDAKKDLVAWLAKKNPDYERARAAFADASKPINQMQVGQELSKSLGNAIPGAGERATVFANSLRNAPQTIKRATDGGGPRYDSIDQVLTPDQVAKANMVLKDLTRDAQFDNLAKAGMQKAQKLAGRSMDTIPQIGMLDRAAMIINNLTRRLEGSGSDKTLTELAKLMQNPKEMGRLMNAATPAERKELADLVMRQGAANVPSLAREFER